MSSDLGVVLDAGAFIALERGDRMMVALTRRLAQAGTSLVTSAGIVAEVWRGGHGRQISIVFLLRRTVVVDVTFSVAKILGRMLGVSRTRDPIDAHIALLARERGWPIITSDAADLRAIDPTLVLEEV